MARCHVEQPDHTWAMATCQYVSAWCTKLHWKSRPDISSTRSGLSSVGCEMHQDAPQDSKNKTMQKRLRRELPNITGLPKRQSCEEQIIQRTGPFVWAPGRHHNFRNIHQALAFVKCYFCILRPCANRKKIITTTS